MKNKIRSVLMIMALALVQAPISSAALLYENFSPDFVTDFPSTMIATEFTVGVQSLTVTKLGAWSQGGGIYNDTKVAIWQVTNAVDPEPLVSAELLQTFGHYEDWLFADVAPTTLLAGGTYRIGAFANPATPNMPYSVNPTYAAGNTFDLFNGVATATPGSYFYFPPLGGERGLNYPTEWSPNTFITANAEFLPLPVPEPSSALLLAIGLAGVWFVRRPGMSSRRPSSLF